MNNQITLIPATDLRDYQRKRVAAYVRVSTKTPEAINSALYQMNYYKKWIGSQPDWELVKVYGDIGKSGVLTKEREEFQEMLTACYQDKIDMVICKMPERFSRNLKDQQNILRKLQDHRVDVYFEGLNIHTQSASGTMLIATMGVMAEQYARTASKRMKWRIKKLYQRGLPANGNRALGYRMVDGMLLIVPEEAEIVRRIYRYYLSGMGYLAITKQLMAEGAKTVHHGNFSHNSLKYILTNVLYIGDLELQKYFVKDFQTKKKIINRSEVDKYYVRSHHQPIIDLTTFSAVQEELVRREEKYSGKHSGKQPRKQSSCKSNSVSSAQADAAKSIPKARESNPLAGYLICGSCGRHYTKKHNHKTYQWQCNNYSLRGKTACSSPLLPHRVLEKETIKAISSLSGTDAASITLDKDTLAKYIQKIVVTAKRELTYYPATGSKSKKPITITWQLPSRKDSWTPEMKQKAREKALAYHANERRNTQ